MILAVASGKGGTGKTTVAAGLVRMWDQPVQAVDLDVEEPNLHLFLKPEITEEFSAAMLVPVPINERCTACRACAEICQFKAITVLGEHLMVFPEMCHGCGGCFLVCPEKALEKGERELGQVRVGRSGQARFFMGRLRVGEAMSPPLMQHVMEHLSPDMDVIIDAPPGTSCPAITAVQKADMVLLVSEPTPFGLHDLKLAREAFEELGKPMALVINRAGIGDRRLHEWAAATGLPILLEIPYDRKIAEAYSRGQVLVEAHPDYAQAFTRLIGDLRLFQNSASQEAAHA